MNKPEFITTVKGSGIKPVKNNPAVVLICDKSGYRMKSYGPIQLLKLGNTRLIDIQIKAIRSQSANSEIILCCGFDANKIAKYIKENYGDENVRIVENQMYEVSGCCEALRISLNCVSSDSLIICNGGMLLMPELVKVHSANSYLLCRKYEKNKTNLEIGSVSNEKNIVTNISFGLPNIWSEIFYLESRDHIER